MKRTETYTAKDDNVDLILNVKMISKDLTKGESETKFSRIIDSLILGLMNHYYYDSIKRKK